MERGQNGYIAAICKKNAMTVFAVGGIADHIHIPFRLPPALSSVRAVTLIKSNSSKWMRETKKTFAWQKGYGAFSVSSSNVSTVIRYIDQQEAHHKKKSFEDEFVALLKKDGVQFDPKYVFDQVSFNLCCALRGSPSHPPVPRPHDRG